MSQLKPVGGRAGVRCGAVGLTSKCRREGERHRNCVGGRARCTWLLAGASLLLLQPNREGDGLGVVIRGGD